jgi:hypothetical protein
VSTLYESIYHAQRKSIQLEAQAEKEARRLAAAMIEGLAREMAAPEGTLRLAPPDEKPDLEEMAPSADVMKRDGRLSWRFGFAFDVRHPEGGILLGQSWGEFTIRQKRGEFEVIWGRETVTLRNQAAEHTAIRHFASELHDDILRIIESGGKHGRMAIGFSSEQNTSGDSSTGVATA